MVFLNELLASGPNTFNAALISDHLCLKILVLLQLRLQVSWVLQEQLLQQKLIIAEESVWFYLIHWLLQAVKIVTYNSYKNHVKYS